MSRSPQWGQARTSEHGARKLGALIEQNVDQAAWLAHLIDAHPWLERHGPAPLNIVCFRYVPEGPHGDLDALNRQITSSGCTNRASRRPPIRSWTAST